MCAICGIVDLAYEENLLSAMLNTMAHRGPDENGLWTQGATALLHSRLSVIDPEGGKQPMILSFRQETYVLVYNGELYNTAELRQELAKMGHCFRGHSDTEVVLHAYAQYADACVDKFNGIFAFAIWEVKAKRLFLARDRIGVKPLFFTQHSGGLIFASEMKTVLTYPTVRARLDREGAAQLLLLGPGRIPGSGVFRDILEVEPGCCGYYQGGSLILRRYWQLFDREHTDSFAETVEKVRYLVLDSIQRQMVSDVPLGTFLSGGLDSSLISAICARKMAGEGKLLKTFSVDYRDNERYFVSGKFQPNSDGAYIRLMLQQIPAEHYSTVLDPEDLIACLEDATAARDLPGMADVDFSLLAFCRRIRSEVKVALSGECADEIFGGYPWYTDTEIRAAEGFPWSQNLTQRLALIRPGLRVPGREFVLDAYGKTCRESDILPENTPEERRLKEMVNLNFRWFMQTLLDRKDRMSMYASLEVRVPFCDYRIAEYLYAVPWEYKFYREKEKGLLRKAMEGILPEEVLWRKKSPYPKTFDPRYADLVGSMLKRKLEKKESPLFELVDRKAVAQMYLAEPIWPWYGQLMRTPQTMAYLLQLDYWLEKYKVELCLE